MSYSEDYDWRCMNCDGFHEYGNCPYYDQSWKNQPRTCWEGYENSNSWNPPPHHYHGEYEHQPFVQEEAWIEAEVQRRLAKLQEEAWIEAEVQKRLAQRLQEEAFIEAAVQECRAQLLQEGFMDRIETNCKDQEELQIEEICVPQALEEEEEEEASEVVIELECAPVARFEAIRLLISFSIN